MPSKTKALLITFGLALAFPVWAAGSAFITVKPAALTASQTQAVNLAAMILRKKDADVMALMQFMNKHASQEAMISRFVTGYPHQPNYEIAGMFDDSMSSTSKNSLLKIPNWGTAPLNPVMGLDPRSLDLLDEFMADTDILYAHSLRRVFRGDMRNRITFHLYVIVNCQEFLFNKSHSQTFKTVYESIILPRLGISPIAVTSLTPESRELFLSNDVLTIPNYANITASKTDAHLRQTIEGDIQEVTSKRKIVPLTPEQESSAADRTTFNTAMKSRGTELEEAGLLSSTLSDLSKSEALKNFAKVTQALGKFYQAAAANAETPTNSSGIATANAAFALMFVMEGLLSSGGGDEQQELLAALKEISEQLDRVQDSINDLLRLCISGFEKVLSSQELLADLSVMQLSETENARSDLRDARLQQRLVDNKRLLHEVLGQALQGCTRTRLSSERFEACHRTYVGYSDLSTYPFVLSSTEGSSASLARELRRTFAVSESATPSLRSRIDFFPEPDYIDVGDAIAITNSASIRRLQWRSQKIPNILLWSDYTKNYASLLASGERLDKTFQGVVPDPITILDELISQGQRMNGVFNEGFYAKQSFNQLAKNNQATVTSIASAFAVGRRNLQSRATSLAQAADRSTLADPVCFPAKKLDSIFVYPNTNAYHRLQEASGQNYTSFTPEIFLLAEYLGLGKVDYCYDWNLSGRIQLDFMINARYQANSNTSGPVVVASRKAIWAYAEIANKPDISSNSYAGYNIMNAWIGKKWYQTFLENSTTTFVDATSAEVVKADVDSKLLSLMKSITPDYATGQLRNDIAGSAIFFGSTSGNLIAITPFYRSQMYDLYADYELLRSITSINKWSGVYSDACDRAVGLLNPDVVVLKALDLSHDADLSTPGKELETSARFKDFNADFWTTLQPCIPVTKPLLGPLGFHLALLTSIRDKVASRRGSRNVQALQQVLQ